MNPTPTNQTDWANTSPAELLEAHLSRPANTARCYAADMGTLGEFLKIAEPVDVVAYVVDLSRGAGERVMHNYLTYLRERYEALNTIRRKAQSLMGLLKLAHRFGVIPWMLEPLKLPAPNAIRDTRGPGRQAVLDMLGICHERDDAKGARDKALLTLMAYGALRCNEALTLDLKHIDIDGGLIDIMAKGLWGRTTHPIPMVAVEAIDEWLDYRGTDKGPLFLTMQHGHAPERLTYYGAYSIVTTLAKRVGTVCSPHKLRHYAATDVLRLTDGNIPLAMAMTRHKDPRTLMIYNDERLTRAREAMEIVAAGIPHYRPKRRS